MEGLNSKKKLKKKLESFCGKKTHSTLPGFEPGSFDFRLIKILKVADPLK